MLCEEGAIDMIFDFTELNKDSIELAGGKASNLGELIQAGANVPGGFVISSKAYRLFMKTNGMASIEGMEPELIINRILQGQMPEPLEKEIKEKYRQLSGNSAPARVAVRSSATAEDLEEASFAGQQETYLNVIGEAPLIEKIKNCYASLWGERAAAYRRKQNFDTAGLALAVAVQQMVESSIAGVMFTTGIITGKRENIIVNSSYGLGESVVSGSVTPDELICGRNGRIISSRTGSKAAEIVYAENGTVSREVEKKRRNLLSISPGQLKQLVREGVRIEAHYGKPMDIEWAFAEGRLYILQARAITTIKDDINSESAVNSKTFKPLKLSKARREALLFYLEKEPFAYYPLDYSYAALAGYAKEKIFSEIGIVMESELRMDDNAFMKLPSAKKRITKNIFRAFSVFKQFKDNENNRSAGEDGLIQLHQKLEEFEKIHYQGLDIETITRLMEDFYNYLEQLYYCRFRYAVFPAFILGKKLEKILKKVDSSWSEYQLLGELDYKTAVINQDMRNLVTALNKYSGLRQAVLDGADYNDLIDRYPETSPLFEDFLQQNGYKLDYNCYWLISRSLNEETDRLLQIIRPIFLADRPREDNSQKQRNTPEAVIYKELLERLKQNMEERKFKKLLPEIEFYRFAHVMREESQYLWEGTFENLRKLYAALCSSIGNQLECPDDLKYLFYEELIEACSRGQISETQKELIGRRKGLRPKAVEDWENTKTAILSTPSTAGTAFITGIPGSSGKAEGPVCLVRGPEEFHKMKNGDILVCPLTDPEWTPLFELAAAVVSDTGGSLSHAAIVAREYGIPAVLGTGTATSILNDGDRIAVYGEAGRVEKLG